MNDYEILKEALNRINCFFITAETLIGYSIIIKTVSREINYEFDHKGNFNRVI